MRAGWNPTRRNRNIGTAKRGHGQDNRLVVPKAWPDDRVFWEVLREPVVVRRRGLAFVVEPPRPGSFHACTPDDIRAVLDFAPPADVNALDAVVLRQPTRKQELLRPVWGRLAFFAGLGTAIYLDAQWPRPIRWSLSLDPEDARELERLRADGHPVRRDRRGWVVEPTWASIRVTQLHRTLLHELGHLVDWNRGAARARTRRAKEDFAHRYAAEVGARVVRTQEVVDAARLRADGLDPAWFTAPR